MLLVDDILLAPVRSLFWIFEEIYHSAQETMATDAESITQELSALYMRLETGKITEEEFAAEEKLLLERLDQAEQSGGEIE
jgi:gas vesicle protein GvpG